MLALYPEGFDFGKCSPMYSASANPNSLTYTFNFSGRYLARLEVKDDYLARGFKEIEINVAHDSTKPLRVNVGSNSQSYWEPFHWRDSSQETIDSLGNLWQPDQQIAEGTWGHVQRLVHSNNLLFDILVSIIFNNYIIQY